MKTLLRSCYMKSMFILVTFIMGITACAPTFVIGTQIDYTPEKQKIADLIEKYRVAVEKKDVETIKSLLGDGYYENASTTDDPSDDYGVKGMHTFLGRLQNEVKAIKYQIKIKAIEILEKNAVVDLEISGHYLFLSQERDRWAQHSDKNRVTLKKERDGWKVVSGL